MRRHGLFLIAACLLALSACGGGQQALESPVVSADHAWSLLYPTGDRWAANQQIVEEHIQSCMKSEGFTYLPRQYEGSGRSSLPKATIGNWTVEYAEEYGFSIAQRSVVTRVPSFEHVQSLSEFERQSWLSAAARCRGVAMQSINSEWELAVEPLRKDFDDVVDEFQSDTAVIELEGKWSECMRSQGYQTASFDTFILSYADAFNDFSLRIGARQRIPAEEDELDELIAAEIRGATDAALCADPLRDQFDSIWLTYQTDFLTESDIPTLAGS